MPPLLRPGDRCDVYEIILSLGTSDAAELYLAREPCRDPCLLKIMAAPGADKQRLRFAQEGVVLAKIAHPSVVQVFGAGAWGERVWLAIERFGGYTLRDRLRTGGPPPLDDLLGWAQQVCAGLGEAHRLGIVHRNLTPEGVVLGPAGLVKVTNFGMAKLASFGVVTTADQQIGSMLYAAPEQLVGKEEIGPRADVYALGVLLYEAITGERPMGPGPYNAMTVVSWHLRAQARPLRERAAARGAPADLEALVHQMLEKAPSRRPVSVLEVHDRLRDARVSLRAPLLREVRNAAPVDRSIALAPTQPMPASPGVTPSGEDRTAVLPARVPVPASPCVVAPPRVAHPAEPLSRPEASGEVRVTGEPVEREARRSRPASRSTMAAIGAVAVTLAAAAAVTGWTLRSHPTGPAQGAGSDPPAPAAPVSAPAPSASAATPRIRGDGAPPRPRAPAPRPKN